MRYNFVAEVQSKSNRNKSYTIKMRPDGLLTCDCPSWIFNQRGNRTCKHIDEIKRRGFSADDRGKFMVGTGDWGERVPVFCKSHPDGCDECSLRFMCYTQKNPEFSKEELRQAGISI